MLPMAAPTLWSWRNLLEALEIARLRDVSRPWREIVSLDDSGEFGRGAEETLGLAGGKSGEPRRLKIRGRPVACLDQAQEIGGGGWGQAEAQRGRCQHTRFDGLIGVADHRFEGRDHIADHVFGSIVEEDSQAASV